MRWRICACSYTDGDASGRRPSGDNADSSSVADVRSYKYARTHGDSAADGHARTHSSAYTDSDCHARPYTYADGTSDAYADSSSDCHA